MCNKDITKVLFIFAVLMKLRVYRYDEFLDRLIQSDVEDKGITFKEFLDFCNFLNNLEDFTIAMRMYSLADRPISEGIIFDNDDPYFFLNPYFADEFHRAVKICTGASLSAHVVRTVFLIFDQDGDGRLSDREFIAIMKDRVHRGLQVLPYIFLKFIEFI